MKKKTVMHIPRSRDDIVLWWLHCRTVGFTAKQIAEADGETSIAYILACTSRIRAADVAESGEPEDTVLAGYW